jgi:hypothetical protein
MEGGEEMEMIKPLCDHCANKGRQSAMLANAFLVAKENGTEVSLADGYGYYCSEDFRFYHPLRGYFSNLESPNDEIRPLVKYCGEDHCTFAKYIASAESSDEEAWTYRCVRDHQHESFSLER